jgi:hypothetical protein
MGACSPVNAGMRRCWAGERSESESAIIMMMSALNAVSDERRYDDSEWRAGSSESHEPEPSDDSGSGCAGVTVSVLPLAARRRRRWLDDRPCGRGP